MILFLLLNFNSIFLNQTSNFAMLKLYLIIKMINSLRIFKDLYFKIPHRVMQEQDRLKMNFQVSRAQQRLVSYELFYNNDFIF